MALPKLPESKLDRAFIIAIYLKALVGVFEFLAGFLLLFVKQVQVNTAAQLLAAQATDGDKDDFLLRIIANYFGHLAAGTVRFAALYLIFDAAVKLVLIYQILHKRYWAYIALICVLSVLIVYQTYRISITHSPLLIALTLFDVLVIYLSGKEYMRHRSQATEAGSD